MSGLKRCLMVVLLLSFLGGCTRREIIPADTLVVALSAQPATLDPRYATDAMGMRLCDLIFSGLVRLGGDLQPAPDAAESWSYRDHVYTFHLRPDLRFHNGRAVGVADVEYSFQQYMKSGPFATSLTLVKAVETERVTTPVVHLVVRIRLKNFNDKFLKSDLPGIKILPKEEIEKDGGAEFSRRLIGTGGFRFVAQGADRIELEGVRAASKHLIFKVIRDDFTRFQKMLKGEVDIAQQEITPDKIAQFQKFPERFNVYFYPGLTMAYVLVNLRDPVLQKLEVRQALAESIQRQDLIRYKMFGHAAEATSILTPNNPYFNPDLKNIPYDPARALKVIESLGLRGHRLVLKTSNSPQAIDNGKVLAYQMAQSGLDVELQSYEWGTFYGDVKKGNFQLATMRWVGTVDPDIYRSAFYSTEKPPGRNRGSYQNAKLDHLLDQGTDEEDIPRRKKIFFEVQKIVQDDLAIIPLWYDGQIAVAKKNISHFQPDQTGEFWSLLDARKDGN